MSKKEKKFIQTAIENSKGRKGKFGRGNSLSLELKNAAFELFSQDMSLAEIGRKLSISKATLYKTRDNDGWIERKAKRLKQAANRADNDWVKIRSRHIALARSLQSKGLERLKTIELDEISASETRSFIAEGVRLERELMGESTNDTEIKIALILPDSLRDV